jgi:FK506-binding protein 2
MRFLTATFAVLAATATFVAATDDEALKIEVTKAVECTRKTKKGDDIEVHYRGTLAADGKQFDASYDRGSPLGFKVGAGMVIKGSAVPLSRVIYA